MPFSNLVKTLPRDIAHIAVDKAEGHYLAFKRDGSLFGRYPIDAQSNNLGHRAASQCAQLSLDEAKTRKCMHSYMLLALIYLQFPDGMPF